MLCKLCQQDRPLRRSHIFPELLYRPIYGPGHTIVTLDPTLPYERKIRKGLTEPLLCDLCESLIQQYEDYFARLWYIDNPLPREVPDGSNAVILTGLDYRLFKLFHMSLCWRAGVSSLRDYAGVSLGPHESRMRAQLLTSTVGPATEYQILATLILRPGTRTPHHGLIVAPSRARHEGLWHYSSLYGACLWHLVMSKSRPMRGALTSNGTMVVGILDATNINGLRPSLKRWARYIRSRMRATDRVTNGGRYDEGRRKEN